MNTKTENKVEIARRLAPIQPYSIKGGSKTKKPLYVWVIFRNKKWIANARRFCDALEIARDFGEPKIIRE